MVKFYEFLIGKRDYNGKYSGKYNRIFEIVKH